MKLVGTMSIYMMYIRSFPWVTVGLLLIFSIGNMIYFRYVENMNILEVTCILTGAILCISFAKAAFLMSFHRCLYPSVPAPSALSMSMINAFLLSAVGFLVFYVVNEKIPDLSLNAWNGALFFYFFGFFMNLIGVSLLRMMSFQINGKGVKCPVKNAS